MAKKITLDGKDLKPIFNKEGQPFSSTKNFLEVSIDEIIPDPEQPRKKFSQVALDELSSSIKDCGIIQPILVKKQSDSTYRIIAGERRWRAAKLAGLTKVPVIISTLTNEKESVYTIVENIQREDLNPVEEAEAFERLINEFQLTHEELSSRVGRSRSHITNMLRLNKLNTFVKQCLVDNEISMGHARVLVPLSSDVQIYYAKLVITKNLSVREIERLIAKSEELVEIKEINPVWLESADQWAKYLTKKLSTKAKVKFKPDGAGKIEISFDSPEVAEWVIKKIT